MACDHRRSCFFSCSVGTSKSEAVGASPTGAVYRVSAKKDASLVRERLMVLQQRLQIGALKQSAWQNAISSTIYPALERARGKHTTRTHAQKLSIF
jgi:hypothetical protein